MSRPETADGTLLDGADLYEMLEVSPRASQDVIRAAYRALARHYHPDVNSDSDAADRIRRLNAAYEILGDPDNRAKYDFELARQQRWARHSAQSAAIPITAQRPVTTAHGAGVRARSMPSGRAATSISRGMAARTQFALGALFVLAAAFVLFLVLWTTLDFGADTAASYVHPSEYGQR